MGTPRSPGINFVIGGEIKRYLLNFSKNMKKIIKKL